MSETARRLGQQVSRVREERGWKQADLATRAGISTAFLSDVENGKRNVSSEVLLKLANALSKSLDYLLKGEEAQHQPRGPVSIPPALSDAAEANRWTYGQTVALLQTRELVQARRAPNAEAVVSVQDADVEQWTRWYTNLFERD
jgi:transcriptional regulator with XRE-family HTH domain